MTAQVRTRKLKTPSNCGIERGERAGRYSDPEARTGGGLLKPSAEVICRQLGETAVLVHLGTNEIFELNRTGYRVWQLLGEGMDRGAIQLRLAQEFSVDGERLDREVGDLLSQLAARQLIVSREP